MMQSYNLPKKVQECLGANHFPTFTSLRSAQPAFSFVAASRPNKCHSISSTFWLFNFLLTIERAPTYDNVNRSFPEVILADPNLFGDDAVHHSLHSTTDATHLHLKPDHFAT